MLMRVRKPNHDLPSTSDRASQDFHRSTEGWAAGGTTDPEEILGGEVFI